METLTVAESQDTDGRRSVRESTMLPKIEAAIAYLERFDRKGPDHFHGSRQKDAIRGKAGTVITA